MSEPKSYVERIRDEVLNTGFPTEVTTASKLESVGWHTSLGLSYMDENTSQSREFDIRAYREIRSSNQASDYYFGLYLLIECKKSQKPWVIFTSPNDQEARFGPNQHRFIPTPDRKDGFLVPTPGRKNGLLSDGLLISNHHYFQTERWGHNYYEAFRGREQADRSTQIYTAITSVINATRFYLGEFKQVDVWRPLVYPVIVLDGDLFEAVVKSDEDVIIAPRNHIILKHHLIPPRSRDDNGLNGVSYLIDIIRSSYVPEYAQKRSEEHKRLITDVNRTVAFERG